MLTKQEIRDIYCKLLLIRLSEEVIRREYDSDAMKTPVHLAIGAEAIAVGMLHALKTEGKTFGTYRNHHVFLAKGGNLDGFFAELYGKKTGVAKGKAGSMHLSSPRHGLLATSAVVATTIPVAVGAALAEQYKGSKNIVSVFFGDGAVEEGAFWESLNFAALKKLPILFVCEDNELAIHTFRKERHGFHSIAKLVEAFDCYYEEVDGGDVLSVLKGAQTIRQNMEQHCQPALIYAPYFRYLEHVGIREDFETGYRVRPAKEVLEARDPILNFERWMLENGFTTSQLSGWKEEIARKIEGSLRRAADADFPSAEELYTDVYAD